MEKDRKGSQLDESIDKYFKIISLQEGKVCVDPPNSLDVYAYCKHIVASVTFSKLWSSANSVSVTPRSLLKSFKQRP